MDIYGLRGVISAYHTSNTCDTVQYICLRRQYTRIKESVSIKRT